VEHLVDEDVEVHVLHDPGDLAYERENDQGKEKFGFLLFGGFHGGYPFVTDSGCLLW
jgi:hypothetical protein